MSGPPVFLEKTIRPMMCFFSHLERCTGKVTPKELFMISPFCPDISATIATTVIGYILAAVSSLRGTTRPVDRRAKGTLPISDRLLAHRDGTTLRRNS